jgi:hypothetical protein
MNGATAKKNKTPTWIGVLKIEISLLISSFQNQMLLG